MLRCSFNLFFNFILILSNLIRCVFSKQLLYRTKLCRSGSSILWTPYRKKSLLFFSLKSHILKVCVMSIVMIWIFLLPTNSFVEILTSDIRPLRGAEVCGTHESSLPVKIVNIAQYKLEQGLQGLNSCYIPFQLIGTTHIRTTERKGWLSPGLVYLIVHFGHKSKTSE